MRQPVYLLFGAGGVLGGAFLKKLSGTSYGHRVFAFDHQKADITDPGQILPIIEYIKPTCLINLAAVNDEDICEEAKAGAFNVNSRGPQLLAEACKKNDIKLVHFSSPTVFDGTRCTPYSERHNIKPINVHGQSKASGEIAIRQTTDNYIVIRPGWIFHYEGNNFLPHWIAQAERNEEIAVLEDHIGSPTYAVDLADATFELIDRDVRGIFHFANSDAATKQQFAEAVMALSKLNGKIVSVNEESQKWFKAQTPKYTALSTKKYSQTVGKEVRPWLEALKHCLFSMNHFNP